MLFGRRLMRRIRAVAIAALAVSWLVAAGGPARAACPFQSQRIFHGYDTWFNGCQDQRPLDFFTGLIANPTGVNNNGQDGVCESGNPAVNGLGQICDPHAGVLGDGQVVVQYDFGAFNQGSLGCPSPLGNIEGGSPVVVMIVDSGGSFTIVRTGYDIGFAGYPVDHAFPLNEAGDQPLNAACSNQHNIQITSTGGGQVCGRVLPPNPLLSDCNADTAGPIVGTCPGPAGNPVITFGRIFTRLAACGTPPDIRLSSGWTPGAQPPDPTTGAFCITLPSPGCGQCWYLAASYRFDGNEIPAVAGFVREAKLPVCIDGDRDGYDDCSDCDDCNPAVHPGAPEVCNGIDDDCNGAVDDLNGVVDADVDGVAGACDNCPLVANPDQSDFNHDGQGDRCDLDDGLILVEVPDASKVTWQVESGFSSFNVYRGDLAVLKSSGVYTQDPAVVPFATKACDVVNDDSLDGVVLQPGQAVFYLVTGNGPAGESSLGEDSAGHPRPNAHPCP